MKIARPLYLLGFSFTVQIELYDIIPFIFVLSEHQRYWLVKLQNLVCASNQCSFCHQLANCPVVSVHVRFDATTGSGSVRAVRAWVRFLPSVSTDMFLEVVAVSTGMSTIRASEPQELPITCCWNPTAHHASIVECLEWDRALYHHLSTATEFQRLDQTSPASECMWTSLVIISL